MTTPKISRRKIADFLPDSRNANKHTQRGMSALETSLRKYGAGRSIVVDKNGKVIGGNATQETAIDIGLTDAIVVPTDGKQLVVVQRTDIDSDSPEAIGLALADNRVGQLDLEWDVEVLKSLQAESVDLSGLWSENEIAALLIDFTVPSGDWSSALGDLPQGDKSPFQQMTFTLADSQAEVVKQAIDKAKASGAFVGTGNENSNGNALWKICDAYLHS